MKRLQRDRKLTPSEATKYKDDRRQIAAELPELIEQHHKRQQGKASKFSAQIRLNEIGEKGQHALSRSRVAIIGCGGLGSHLAQTLARAGVGQLLLVDPDTVSEKNLHRQVLFDYRDVGMYKVFAASIHLEHINPDVEVVPIRDRFRPGGPSVISLLHPPMPDLILDGTDNLETRFFINDFALRHEIPWVYAGCTGYGGMVMSFTPDSPCFRCLWKDEKAAGKTDLAGVVEPTVALASAYQAMEAIKILTGNKPRAGLLRFDIWKGQTHVIEVKRSMMCALHKINLTH